MGGRIHPWKRKFGVHKTIHTANGAASFNVRRPSTEKYGSSRESENRGRQKRCLSPAGFWFTVRRLGANPWEYHTQDANSRRSIILSRNFNIGLSTILHDNSAAKNAPRTPQGNWNLPRNNSC